MRPVPPPAMHRTPSGSAETSAEEIASDGEESRRELICREILTTERSYVLSLQVCIDEYKNPLMIRKALSQKDAEIVFANVNKIIRMNAEMLQVCISYVYIHQNKRQEML